MLALAPRCEAKVCSSCKVKDKTENSVWTDCIEALMNLNKSVVKTPYLYHRDETKAKLVRVEVCGFEKGAPVWVNKGMVYVKTWVMLSEVEAREFFDGLA